MTSRFNEEPVAGLYYCVQICVCIEVQDQIQPQKAERSLNPFSFDSYVWLLYEDDVIKIRAGHRQIVLVCLQKTNEISRSAWDDDESQVSSFNYFQIYD